MQKTEEKTSQRNTNFVKRKQQENRNFIDFRQLSNTQISMLRDQWEKEARIYESKLSVMMGYADVDEDRINSMWNTANSLWKKLRVLENWLKKYKS